MGIHSLAQRAAIIAAAVLVLSLLVLFIPFQTSTEFLSEHIEATQMRDLSAQRAAHLVLMLLLAVTCGAILISRPRQRD